MKIISLGYLKSFDLAAGSGIITEINKYEFYHNIPTEDGSSGSPIILPETRNVIGIINKVIKKKD